MSLTVRQWTADDAVPLLRVPAADDHKYSRGALGVRTGSSQYPGAAVLTAEAAWRTGIGLVTFVSPQNDAPSRHGLPSPAAAVLARRPETVFADDIATAVARCDAWVIGSGTDAATRSPAEHEALLQILAGAAPVVVDAGAIELTRRSPGAPVIVTPHMGEFTSLWQAAGLRSELSLTSDAQPLVRAAAAHTLARSLGITVLLKGSITTVASPHTDEVIQVGPATPWLATAGTGDVLAGVLGALVASHAAAVHAEPRLLAALGATAALLHDLAARIAGGPCTALDVAAALPQAIASLR